MKKFLLALSIGVLSLGLTVSDAEAKRFGGGKSSGMQRESVTQRQAAPAQQHAATPAAPASAAAPKRNWLGPIAGLAAGLGIAALLSHFGMGEGMGNFLMIALLAMAAIFIVKMLMRRNAPAAPAAHPGAALQYAGVGAPAVVTPTQSQATLQTFGSSTPAPVQTIPEGFDVEGFVRVAKLNFVRLQTSNDAKNLDDIREFVSPELFAEIKLQMDERGSAPQQTDVVTLNAELLEVVSEGNRHIASVHFSGMIREEAGAAASPFNEVWNLSKPLDGSKGWTVGGIQQLS
jgi:predicted lipid-binding transport protein (Tim44 family)